MLGLSAVRTLFRRLRSACLRLFGSLGSVFVLSPETFFVWSLGAFLFGLLSPRSLPTFFAFRLLKHLAGIFCVFLIGVVLIGMTTATKSTQERSFVRVLPERSVLLLFLFFWCQGDDFQAVLVFMAQQRRRPCVCVFFFC